MPTIVENLQKYRIFNMFLLVMVLILSGCLSFNNDEEESYSLNLIVNKNNNGSYKIVVKSKINWGSIDSVRYYVINETYRTIQHGTVGLKNVSGDWFGIDVTWDDDGNNDTNINNGKADRAENAGGSYTDAIQAQIRIQAVINGSQNNVSFQRSEGVISASFHDNDFNGILSNDDYFIIKGNNVPDFIHSANDTYSFDIMTEKTDILFKARLNNY